LGGLGAPGPLAGVVDPAGGLGVPPAGLTVGADRLGVLGAAGFLLEAAEGLAELPSQLWRCGNEGFAGIAAAMDALAVQLECARVGLVAQAESRGVVDGSSSPSGAAWLMAHSFHLEPAEASQVVKLAHLCALPKNQVMAAADGGRDLRPADRRRAEALIEVCRRATAAGGAAPATTKAQVVVLIDYDVLAGGVRGAGTTLAGEVLSPATVRRLGCDASLIPTVLGGAGQPLDVGRSRRLVTAGLLAALWVRDRGCTFPECGRPPQWCEGHHVRHWAAGGQTALTNLALLCAYHHSYVHRRDLTATVTAYDVTWHT